MRTTTNAAGAGTRHRHPALASGPAAFAPIDWRYGEIQGNKRGNTDRASAGLPRRVVASSHGRELRPWPLWVFAVFGLSALTVVVVAVAITNALLALVGAA